MELDILYRLSMLVGFLLAGFLALLIAGAAALICHCSKKAFRELDEAIRAKQEEIDTAQTKLDEAMKELEEVCKDVDES